MLRGEALISSILSLNSRSFLNYCSMLCNRVKIGIDEVPSIDKMACGGTSLYGPHFFEFDVDISNKSYTR